MGFTLRPTTVSMQERLFQVYALSPRMAMLEVGTGGGKTYGAIHTVASIDPDLHMLIFSTNAVLKSNQWDTQVADYNEVMGSHLTFDIFNYEKLALDKHYAIIRDTMDAARSKGKHMVIVLDEIHLVKLAANAKASKRSKRLIEVTRQPGVLTTLGLSATTVTNSLLDMSTYLIIAGFYKSSRDFIKQHVKRYDEYHTPIVKDKSGKIREDYFNNPEYIKGLYKMITVKVDTSEYMPDVTETHLRFKLTKEQRTLYNQTLKDFDMGLYEFPVQVRAAQNKLLSNHIFEQKDLALIGILERRRRLELDGIMAPILIFYEYTATLNHLDRIIKELYPEYPIYYIAGTRKKPKNMGEPEDNRSVYLIQYTSGAEGLDWQWANCSVFYEGPTRTDKFVQAKGRNVRNKSIMPHVYHYFLKYINTLDSQRWDNMNNKTSFTKRLADELFYKELNEAKQQGLI